MRMLFIDYITNVLSTIGMAEANTVGWCLAILFLIFQIYFFISTIKKLGRLLNFFPNDPYLTTYETDKGYRIANVDRKKYPSLYKLVEDLNIYVGKTKGTTDFAIIQNKTERELNTMIEDATSKLSFPTYIGLMGTFAGVFIGLLFFNSGIDLKTNLPIYQLISGVLVSMITSFVGLLFSTINNAYSSSIIKQVDNRKNIFYDFLQNELMPTLDTSMVVALNKLHETVNLMQPSFTAAINEFKSAFQASTAAFGKDFRASVNELNQAVNVMRNGLNSINQNIEGQKELIESLKSDRFIGVLSAFVDTADYFNKVVERLNEVTQYTSQITSATKQLIETQQAYNQSLQIPANLFNEINNLLNRVKKFEQSMNEIGETIKKNQIWGMEFAQILKLHTDTIAKNSRQIEFYLDTSGNKIEKIFKGEEAKMEILSKAHQRALDDFYDKVNKILDNQAKDLKTKHDEFARKLDEVFNFDDVHDEFVSLKKLNEIAETLSGLKGQFDTIFNEVDIKNQSQNIQKLKNVEETLNKIKETIELLSKNIAGEQNAAHTGQSQQKRQVYPQTENEKNPYAQVPHRVIVGLTDKKPIDDSYKMNDGKSNNRQVSNSQYDGDNKEKEVPIWKKMFPWLK